MNFFKISSKIFDSLKTVNNIKVKKTRKISNQNVINVLNVNLGYLRDCSGGFFRGRFRLGVSDVNTRQLQLLVQSEHLFVLQLGRCRQNGLETGDADVIPLQLVAEHSEKTFQVHRRVLENYVL